MSFVGIPVYEDTRVRFNSLKRRGKSADLLLNEMIDLYQNINTKQKFSLRSEK